MLTGFKICFASCLIAAAVAAASARQPATAAQPDAIRAAFLKMIDRPRVALEPRVRSRPELDGLIAEEISFAAEAGQRVPTLLIKRSESSRQPVVIVLHGTGGSKEGMAARLRDLAAKGFVAVAIDGRYHGERAGPSSDGMSSYLAAILRTYRTGREHPFLYDTVWDVMRLLDYLETRPDVDRSRIGLTGISKGGMETYLAAAVDPRVAVAVPMIGVQSFRWALDHGAWDSRAWTLREAVDAAAKEAGSGVGAPFMRRFYDKVAPGVYGEFDGPSMLALIAPRPLLVINGDSDPRTPIGGVRACMAAAEQAYKAQGASDRLVLHLQPDAGHQVTPEADRVALQWFERWLQSTGRSEWADIIRRMRDDLPGHDLIEQGLEDLAAGTETAAALLVSIGAPRLGELGLPVAHPIPGSEHRLYDLLSRTDPDSAHSRYNALIRRLVSFERALACAR